METGTLAGVPFSAPRRQPVRHERTIVKFSVANSRGRGALEAALGMTTGLQQAGSSPSMQENLLLSPSDR